MITIKKGLDIPIKGAPQQELSDGKAVTTVATLGEEYVGMRPTMHVKEGDQVKKGQLIFEDKKNPGVKYTAPGAGVVKDILRGERRVLQAVVIELKGDEQVTFDKFDSDKLNSLGREKVQDILVESGQWTALRTRPYSKTPALDAEASAIFINAMDSNPLAGDPTLFINEQKQAFIDGLKVLSNLTEGKLFVCKAGDAEVDTGDADVTLESFSGPHPSGLVGTHIHFLQPASIKRPVWHIGYQDVIAYGKLFTTGEIFTDRVVAVAGEGVKEPRLLRTRLGANLHELTDGELSGDNQRIISGSVLHGHTADNEHAWLGRFHNQVSVIPEGNYKEFLGWIRPGSDLHSVTRAYAGHFNPKKLFSMTTSLNGSSRSMVPIGNYERVMPLDILPTLLLRDLLSGDTDEGQQLGCLELDEEDLALCTYVCPGKYEYGPVLRDCLTKIEKEG
ncbi:Na(+)-translocating NADH-quinone reductase subunit A [Idiomarina loihiensis]|jgi:Na+-transporting NADH:ubiquinone oxidoreductase subunit A|uniref:Na(+)-translocating NADH-quinone reductase subunit A n=1 Tax=Idiomarina TaxID=135575 RepID=UPI000D70AB76|nr:MULTISPECIES: Na(+)-translocating NADH-quinone reductase subunit A [Idiomarina]MRJ43487.1 Na(+)-translocating NADH-quinone reductase subunit A [Idiomarina loihiensis]PWW41573.1 Na(+)-translocating NADH:ubiquinone oxidoreductase A subunit [Idiomarina loihiensis]TDP50631.1 Na(+)-translocating NADH:ubiquinone oxidoreductase A subunit [Idiomarina loihiensis]TDS25091.1 Na(+)-translocating NADH:ubiquinone oxidoreductase A subunit [Idiomarina sp. H2]UTW31851.1 Na(+)-translocating NADH-quinone redu